MVLTFSINKLEWIKAKILIHIWEQDFIIMIKDVTELEDIIKQLNKIKTEIEENHGNL